MRKLPVILCFAPAVFLAVLLTGCGYDRFGEPSAAAREQGAGDHPIANITLADFVARGGGQPVRIEDSLVFSGRVTSNDREGNFSRVLVIENGGAGVEILAGLDGMWSLYPTGTLVYVSARGLVFDGGGGIPVLGCDAQPAGVPQAGYFATRPLLERHLRATDDVQPLPPAPRTIGELTAKMCGTLAVISGLHYAGSAGDVWADRGDAWREFDDAGGGRVMVFVAGGAAFASQRIPAGEVAVCGVVEKMAVGGAWVIVPRGAGDITQPAAK